MRTLSDYKEFLDALLKALAHETHFESTPVLSNIIQNPRLLVIINHSTPLSWIPAMSLLALKVIEAGGHDRTPRGVVDRWFYTNPITKILAEYLSQSDRPLNFEELVEHFKNADKTDLVIFPEGAYTFFGGVHEVQRFRSDRFVEIALKCDAPILIVTHKGSESWSLPLILPHDWGNFILPFSEFFGKKILASEPLNVPLFPQKMNLFSMKCELYQPQLRLEDLSENLEIRRKQIESESLRIKEKMNSLLETI